ncbi:MAG: exonuclease SbcCD subunit D [Bacteroidales bacterium]|nr:exonuclease SbcCD subunit D [Bacteroidales bacterium]
MKFIHISDLHIGKRVNEKALIEEQTHILGQICDIVAARKPDAVLIAGDVYDKAVPSGEAVLLFDDFLTRLSTLVGHVFVISGNHDSAERIAFGSRIMSAKGIHLSPVYDGETEPMTLSDEYGEVDIYMLPYIRPVHVRHFLSDEDKTQVDSYDSAVRKAIGMMAPDPQRRNVLVTHQFVTGALRSESEDVNVGGLDNVDASAFDCFDYVALGHLHRPQDCGDERVRYSGSPLKYSFSEVYDNKSLTVVVLKEKGVLEREFVPLLPLHDWHDLRGTYEELTSRAFYAGKPWTEDFVRITLTDEQDIPDAIGKLRTIYHNLMELRYDNKRTQSGFSVSDGTVGTEEKTPMELFSEFYAKQNGDELSDDQKTYLMNVVEKIWEDSK